MPDISGQLSATVAEACAKKQPLCITGSGSKRFLVLQSVGTPLSLLPHSGIVAYEPTELVVTVRAGTPLAEVEAALAAEKQMLAFEPPQFGGDESDSKPGGGTVGGAVACGLSGPRRPWAGAARDFVLGTRVINGRGEDLRFGGEVMKNVAGYDVSRLMAGAFGALGVLHEVSFKVLPMPECEQTRVFEQSAAEFITFANALSGRALPLSAACWVDGAAIVRLSGSAAGVNQAVRDLGGEVLRDAAAFWRQIRDHRHAFFAAAGDAPGDAPGAYWRVSLPPAAAPLELADARQLIDWGGAQRWVKTEHDPTAVRALATQAGGHAALWHGHEKAFLRPPLPAALVDIHKKLKTAFDPAGVLNPGAFYPFM